MHFTILENFMGFQKKLKGSIRSKEISIDFKGLPKLDSYSDLRGFHQNSKDVWKMILILRCFMGFYWTFDTGDFTRFKGFFQFQGI